MPHPRRYGHDLGPPGPWPGANPAAVEHFLSMERYFDGDHYWLYVRRRLLPFGFYSQTTFGFPKAEAERIAARLKARGWNVRVVHGGKSADHKWLVYARVGRGKWRKL